jgi:hypothetical protein
MWTAYSVLLQSSAKIGPVEVGGSPHPELFLVLVTTHQPAVPPWRVGTSVTLAPRSSPAT